MPKPPPILSGTLKSKILQELSKKHPLTLKELSKLLGVNRDRVFHHINLMRREGYITTEGKGENTLVWLRTDSSYFRIHLKTMLNRPIKKVKPKKLWHKNKKIKMGTTGSEYEYG